jgi:hypothetical protein
MRRSQASSAHKLYTESFTYGRLGLSSVGGAEEDINSEVSKHLSDPERARQLNGVERPEYILKKQRLSTIPDKIIGRNGTILISPVGTE